LSSIKREINPERCDNLLDVKCSGPCRFKWTRPFRRKTKSGFCACAITFQTQSTLFDHPLCERIPVLQPCGFYPCPSERDFKALRGLGVCKSCLALCLQNERFISMNKSATFGYVIRVFLSRDFKIISENF